MITITYITEMAITVTSKMATKITLKSAMGRNNTSYDTYNNANDNGDAEATYNVNYYVSKEKGIVMMSPKSTTLVIGT